VLFAVATLALLAGVVGPAAILEVLQLSPAASTPIGCCSGWGCRFDVRPWRL